MKETLHPCELIYSLSARPIYGNVEGICRITGSHGKGVEFNKWIKPTFTDFASLKPGTIISNEALFCFDESSTEIQVKLGREKAQRFRTYSHVVINGEWRCYTKANKREIFNDIISGAELVSLNDSGQKHILFKHRTGFWQLDDTHIVPDLDLLKYLHSTMTILLDLGFSQSQIISGDYFKPTIMKVGIDVWSELENKIKIHRGSRFFDFTTWMLFTNK